jgi:hypothetical protein
VGSSISVRVVLALSLQRGAAGRAEVMLRAVPGDAVGAAGGQATGEGLPVTRTPAAAAAAAAAVSAGPSWAGVAGGRQSTQMPPSRLASMTWGLLEQLVEGGHGGPAGVVLAGACSDCAAAVPAAPVA